MEAEAVRTDSPGPPLRVLVAGGGVAAMEALLALKALAHDRTAVSLFAPDPSFHYRPLSVTEPFDLSAPRALDLAEVTLSLGGTFLRDSLAEVDAEAQVAITAGGRELDYDALLIAVGARGTHTIPGAIGFQDSADHGSFKAVLDELEAGKLDRVVFAVPDAVAWPLGLYELAFLTSARTRELGLEHVEISLVTPEVRPMAVFGEAASAVVGDLLTQADVETVLNRRPVSFEDGLLTLNDGEPIPADRAVSLPVPEAPSIPGIPTDDRGFIPTDRFCGVLGLDRVFAAGDATWFPVKQGGIATQAADCAARAIAALAGAPVDPEPFQPVLRGALMTEWGPRYLRNAPGETRGRAARSPLWWPPAKVAGKYLAPYLASSAGYRGAGGKTLGDLDAPPRDDPADTESGHEDAVGLALSSARASAASQDFKGALRWLEVAENLELYLPREQELQRVSWQARAAGNLSDP